MVVTSSPKDNKQSFAESNKGLGVSMVKTIFFNISTNCSLRLLVQIVTTSCLIIVNNDLRGFSQPNLFNLVQDKDSN